MYQISNTDYAQIVRFLASFCSTKGITLREQEERRKAALLRRRMEKKKMIPNEE